MNFTLLIVVLAIEANGMEDDCQLDLQVDFKEKRQQAVVIVFYFFGRVFVGLNFRVSRMYSSLYSPTSWHVRGLLADDRYNRTARTVSPPA